MRSRWTLSFCLLLSLTLTAQDAFAYLDPSTGGMILSAIIGMFATAALAMKTFWYKIRNLFRGGKEEEEPRKQRPGEARPPAARPD